MSVHHLPLALVFLVLGFGLGCLFTSSGGREPPKNGEHLFLQAIDARLERIELALGRERADTLLQAAAPPAARAEPAASAPPGGERIAVEPEPRAPADEPAPDPIAEQLAQLHAAVESLRTAVSEHVLPARFPSLDMLRAAPALNAPELESLLAQAYAGSAANRAMVESVRYTSQDDVLARFGRPTRILDNGSWGYDLSRPHTHRWVSFEFVENYVSNVTCTGP